MKKYGVVAAVILLVLFTFGMSRQSTAQYEQNEIQLLARCVNGEGVKASGTACHTCRCRPGNQSFV